MPSHAAIMKGYNPVVPSCVARASGHARTIVSKPEHDEPLCPAIIVLGRRRGNSCCFLGRGNCGSISLHQLVLSGTRVHFDESPPKRTSVAAQRFIKIASIVAFFSLDPSGTQQTLQTRPNSFLQSLAWDQSCSCTSPRQRQNAQCRSVGTSSSSSSSQ